MDHLTLAFLLGILFGAFFLAFVTTPFDTRKPDAVMINAVSVAVMAFALYFFSLLAGT